MATIKDVAKHAGVSVATISRFFSHPEKLSDARREQVRLSVEALHYSPNVLAQNLIKSRANSVMILMPAITHAFSSSITESAYYVASQRGYSVLIGQTGFDPKVEAKYLRRLKSKLADGFIIFSSNVHPEMLAKEKRIPCVNIMECQANAPYPTVVIDNEKAAEDMTNYLLGLGHTKIAILWGRLDGKYHSPVSDDRKKGFNKAAQKAGIAVPDNFIIEGDYSIKAGSEAAKKIIAMPPSERPTAILCTADSMAIGLIKALQNAGIRCPEDISITGFDDLDLAEFIRPSLTTVRQPAKTMGELAMNVLIDEIEGKEITFNNEFIPHEIIVRDSTRALTR